MSGSNGRADRRRKELRAHYGRNVYVGGMGSNWPEVKVKGGALLRNMKPRWGITKRLGYKPKEGS